MKRTHIHIPPWADPKWRIPILTLSVFSLLLFLSLTFSLLQSPSPRPARPDDSHLSSLLLDRRSPSSSLPSLPRLAYLISGTAGDGRRMRRLLRATYHPNNYYALHLDLAASDDERLDLARFVRSDRVLRDFRNVFVIGRADLLTYKGPTVIASTLHGVALLLKWANEWDWFINLSASDYPLISQDDLLHIFSYLPRDLNFLDHSSDIGWKEHQRARPIIIDPGLYHAKKSGVFWAKEKRSLPSAFKLFTGSEWMVLTKSFLDFCIWGWDNLPRTLLMYYTNFLSSQEGYFHTVICNHQNYQNTTVNHDLRFLKWENPPKAQPMNLTLEFFEEMVQSGAPFARRFAEDDAVLDRIDRELLGRGDGRFTPGGWCIGRSRRNAYNTDSGDSVPVRDPCLVAGTPDVIKPSVKSKRLERLMFRLLDPESFRSRQCT